MPCNHFQAWLLGHGTSSSSPCCNPLHSRNVLPWRGVQISEQCWKYLSIFQASEVLFEEGKVFVDDEPEGGAVLAIPSSLLKSRNPVCTSARGFPALCRFSRSKYFSPVQHIISPCVFLLQTSNITNTSPPPNASLSALLSPALLWDGKTHFPTCGGGRARPTRNHSNPLTAPTGAAATSFPTCK